MMKIIKPVAIAGFVILLLAIPVIVRSDYYMHIAILTGLNIMLVCGVNMIQGYSGRVTLGHHAFLGIGAYTAALLALRLGTPWWLDMILAGVLAAIMGLIIGAITLRLKGPYFVIITLAFAQIIAIIVLNWVDFTNGAMGLRGIPVPRITIPGLIDYEFQSKTPYYYLIALLAVLAVYVVYRFAGARVGRAAVGIRENQDLAESVGINSTAYLIIPFVLATALAGLAGGFYAHYVTFISPDLFRFSWMVSMLIMLIAGGPGTILGPLIGALIFTLLPEWLRFAEQLRLPIFGLMLIAIVIFLPRGIYPTLQEWYASLRKHPVRKQNRQVDGEASPHYTRPHGD
jgi:branched-chain amino acid transport system permease protein